MSHYNPEKIESKWQKHWQKSGLYQAANNSSKPKYYCLDMFPYPSGAGLHVGHPKGYIATDVVARMKMMQGYNVLHPMGWDAFGLPAENYAIKNKVHPSVGTAKNVEVFKKQIEMLGFTYDWNREVNTTDPNYYKWTQWAFIQMFNKGLAFESFEPINWCSECKTGLANEDLEDGKCERCGTVVEQKPLRQWVLKITDYAERLLNDIDTLNEWPAPIREMQRNWIGKSEGALVKFQLTNSPAELEVFTTRPDTLFGATYCVVAPEHPLLQTLKDQISNWTSVEEYLDSAKKKTALERTELQKDKTGIEIIGVKAINPANQEELPIFVADYVLGNYGTGAIMAVPAHDERDWEFAKKHNLEIIEVVKGGVVSESAYTSEGEAVNSDFLNGLQTPAAKTKMIAWLEEKRLGQKKIQYKLRDWVFSRQRYWGEPIPLVKCSDCGWVPVPEDQLPLVLPEVKNYEPTGTGESPLANISDWVNTTCPKCGGPAKRETNTMPQWAGSCWYYLRYMDNTNAKELVNSAVEKYWSPVDLYVGGAEHATRHLIYARFWHKFLFDIGVVSTSEPFAKLQNVGLVLAEDGRKMSKRWNNVVNPDDVVSEYGADAMRMYEMFMGPFDQPCAWSTKGVVGTKRFLDKAWSLADKAGDVDSVDRNFLAALHTTIQKVTEDINDLHFNTAVAALMSLLNAWPAGAEYSKPQLSVFVRLIAPFAPHWAEEMWQRLGYEESVFKAEWPKADLSLTKKDQMVLAVQVNGKLRDTLTVSSNISEEEAKSTALASDKVQKWLEGKEPKKVIYVPGKLISIVL